jgi:hypothetical protein
MPQRLRLQNVLGGDDTPVMCVRCARILPLDRGQTNAVYLGGTQDAIAVLCPECLAFYQESQNRLHGSLWFCVCMICERYFDVPLDEVMVGGAEPSSFRRSAHSSVCTSCSSTPDGHTFRCAHCLGDGTTNDGPSWTVRHEEGAAYRLCRSCVDDGDAMWERCVDCDEEHIVYDDPHDWPTTFDEETESCMRGYGCQGGPTRRGGLRNRFEGVCMVDALASEVPDNWHPRADCNCSFCAGARGELPPAPSTEPPPEAPTMTITDATTASSHIDVNLESSGWYDAIVRSMGESNVVSDQPILRETPMTDEPETPSSGHDMCRRLGCARPIISDYGRIHRLCDRCLDALIPECYQCHRRREGQRRMMTSDDPVYVCNGCFGDMLGDGRIEMCEIQCGNAMFRDDPVCTCGGLYHYNYKPDFFTMYVAKGQRRVETHPYLGVEIEMEGKTTAARNKVSKMVHDQDVLPLYCQFDGSLNREMGVEVVSHPFTYEWLNENWEAWKKLLNKFRKMGFRAWDTQRCGMHVHVAKNAMRLPGGHPDLEHRANFCHMVYEYPGLAVAIAGRGRDDRYLEQYASLDKEPKARLMEKVEQNTNFGNGHYVAVNVENTDSMELRIFRGTLNPLSFRKNIEFVHSLWAFTKGRELEKANEYNYMKWLIDKNAERYPALLEYLNERYVV